MTSLFIFSLRAHPDDRFTRSKATTSALPKKKTSSNPKKNKKAPWKRRFFLWALNLFLWIFFGLATLCFWFSYDLPNVERLEATTRKPSVTLLARDKTVLATYGDLYGSMVELSTLPSYVPAAIMAIEDRRFYHHFGVDVLGILRAAWINYQSGAVVQGGSTLTQQLAKNFLLSEKMYTTTDRSFRRKIQEVLLALWLEHKFSKKQILTLYLNRVYLGAGVYGLEAAAHKYFHKSASHLTLYEAAVIAGLLKAPSRYSPLSNPELAHQRAQTVLTTMKEAGYITQDQRNAFASAPSSMQEGRENALIGRYFGDWIVETLDEYIGSLEEDVVVQTTLDPRLQRLAEEKSYALLESEGPRLNFSQASLVTMTPDGGVRAMVGGRNYRKSQFNRVTQARRQIGSAFKYFIFLCALEKGLTPSSLISDMPLRLGKWQPKNYKYQSKGTISLQDAFALSVNAVAVRLATQAGIKKMTGMAQRLGLTSPQPQDMTISLGSGQATLLELTAAYAAVANHGFAVWPYGITEVYTAKTGRILYKRKSQSSQRVLNSFQVLSMLKIMSAAFVYGTGKAAFIQRPCAGKTGTSQKYRDAWAIGFTPDLVTGVWVGNDAELPMKGVTGGKIPARIWHDFMRAAHEGYPVHTFPGS